MNPISKIWMALASIARHPVNKNRKLLAVVEYGFIQMAARLIPGEVCLEFPNHTRLLISPSMKGAAHFIAPRLCEFAQMSFVMHFLRADELFADVGANLSGTSGLTRCKRGSARSTRRWAGSRGPPGSARAWARKIMCLRPGKVRIRSRRA